MSKARARAYAEILKTLFSTVRGDVIFLCDQDDVWLPNKVERVMKAIENGADVVLHDAMMTDRELNVTDESFFSLNGSKRDLSETF